jgi:cobalamin biosynthesis Mg chelatase CobN
LKEIFSKLKETLSSKLKKTSSKLKKTSSEMTETSSEMTETSEEVTETSEEVTETSEEVTTSNESNPSWIDKAKSVLYFFYYRMKKYWKSRSMIKKYVLAPFFGLLHAVYLTTLFGLMTGFSPICSGGLFIYCILCILFVIPISMFS